MIKQRAVLRLEKKFKNYTAMVQYDHDLGEECGVDEQEVWEVVA